MKHEAEIIRRPSSSKHPNPECFIPVSELWRYKFNSDCPGPKKPGWYHVVDSTEAVRGFSNPPVGIRDIYKLWLYRNGQWYDGEVHTHAQDYETTCTAVEPPEFWTDEDMFEDSSDWDIDDDGAMRLLEAILTDWAKDYRDAYKKWVTCKDKNSRIKVETLEYELTRPGLLNSCLMGLDPEEVLAYHRNHYTERI